MTRKMRNTVVALVSSLALVMSCACSTSLASSIHPSLENTKTPEVPTDVSFMKVPSLLGASLVEIEKQLGSGEYKSPEEEYCVIPLLQKDPDSGKNTVMEIKGKILKYRFENPGDENSDLWTIERNFCVLNDIAVGENFEGFWLDGSRVKQYSYSLSDLDLTLDVFWGDYKGDYKADKKKEEPDNEKSMSEPEGPKYSL